MLTISKIVYNIKNTRKINGNSPRWTSAASERAQPAKRAERSGALGKLCDPKPFQEASVGKRSKQEARKKIKALPVPCRIRFMLGRAAAIKLISENIEKPMEKR